MLYYVVLYCACIVFNIGIGNLFDIGSVVFLLYGIVLHCVMLYVFCVVLH